MPSGRRGNAGTCAWIRVSLTRTAGHTHTHTPCTLLSVCLSVCLCSCGSLSLSPCLPVSFSSLFLHFIHTAVSVCVSGVHTHTYSQCRRTYSRTQPHTLTTKLQKGDEEMRILREILVHAQHQWAGGGDAGGQYWWRDRQGAVGRVQGQGGRVDAALPPGSSSLMLSDSRMHPVSCNRGRLYLDQR